MFTDLPARAARKLSGKTVLVTGGAGTIGSALAYRLLAAGVRQLRLLDHNEEKAFYLDLAHRKDPRVRVLLGDIRDRDRMTRALQGVEVVVHAAALKHVGLGEYNPFEVVNTNLTALQTLIEVCLDLNVETFVFTSSDKAVNPTNVMGGSKFIGERLVVAANGYRGPKRTVFACTRFGNVLFSAGSALALFEKQIAAGGPVTVTDPDMTRFFMSLTEACDLVVGALAQAKGGEIFVPKMHALTLRDLVQVLCQMRAPGKVIPTETIGLRPGEKFYEELITDHELPRCLETEKLLIVLPYLEGWEVVTDGTPHKPGPEDYPDRPRWAGQLYSSKTAEPLARPLVRKLLEAATAGVTA